MAQPDARPTVGVADYRNANELKRQLYDRVRTWADLRLLNPDRDHPALVEMGLDCFHMARWTPHSLRDLQRAEAGKIPTVNSHRGAATTVDRLAKCRRIETAGIHVPRYEFGTAEEISLDPPVVVKPRDEFASGGHELGVIFAGDIDFPGERFVQRYIAPRMSFKLFQIGEHSRSTRHPPRSGVDRSMRSLARETATTAKFERLLATVAGLFGLNLFELDVVVHKGVYVIDVNPVVSLDGVEDAVEVYDELLRRSARTS
jgi:glutathione synthase/RimK-type ligase-like ATP-grasp enzyme